MQLIRKPDLPDTLRLQQERGGIVLLHGPAGCGKTWTIEQLFQADANIDRKGDILTSPASFDVSLRARDLWNSRTHPAIAIDEAHIYRQM